MATIKDGSTVTLDYTMTLDNGEIIDSTRDVEPLTYVQGQGEIIAGLELFLAGKAKGETHQVVVEPDRAFGEIDQEAFIEIPRTDLPPEGLEVGTTLQGQGPQGQSIEGRVVEVRENSAVIDFNHPLAGKTMTFDVTIVDVK
jgi:FKBP-type peptidyl-prolyl cis-trans isomerase SlyD